MADLGDELEASWVGEADENRSLRELADYFNHRLLQSAIEEAGLSLLDGEVENMYRLLTDDGVSQGDRTQAQRRLAREGIDVDQLQTDFVSYQAIRSYLRKHRGVEYPTNDDDRLETESQNIQRVVGRAEAIARNKLKQLRAADEIEIGTFRVSGTLRVLCGDCGAQYAIDEFLEQRHCDCTG